MFDSPRDLTFSYIVCRQKVGKPPHSCVILGSIMGWLSHWIIITTDWKTVNDYVFHWKNMMVASYMNSLLKKEPDWSLSSTESNVLPCCPYSEGTMIACKFENFTWRQGDNCLSPTIMNGHISFYCMVDVSPKTLT